MRLNFDSWFKHRILHVPNWIEIMLNNLCLLEWEFKTRHSCSAILLGKTMRRLNQTSRTYSFESTKISIWFGACKMRRLNQALLTEREGRTGEYWPEVVTVRTEHREFRTKTTEGQYSLVRLEQARLVSSLLYGTRLMLCILLSNALPAR